MSRRGSSFFLPYSLAPLRVESLPVLTQDLSFLRKALGHKVDAIVGLDVLRKSSFTIDYRTKEMLLGPVESWPFPLRSTTEMPVVTIRTNSKTSTCAWWSTRAVRT